MTARNKVCFHVQPDDAREMSPVFVSGETTLEPENIEPHTVEHLFKYGSDNPVVQMLIDYYLRPLQEHKHSGQIEIKRGEPLHETIVRRTFNPEAVPVNPKVADPTGQLNHLFYEVMKTGNGNAFIPPQIVYGFSNIGRGFYSDFLYAFNKRSLLTGGIRYPSPLIVEGSEGLYCARPPDTSKEQMYHFLFHLRATMAHLAQNPIGKRSSVSASDIARMLTQLPKRAAFVRSGEDVGVIYTEQTAPHVDDNELRRRLYLIRGQTRQKYCRPKDDPDIDVGTIPTEPNIPNSGGLGEPPLSRWEEVE